MCYKIICFLPPVIQGNINTKEIHNSPPSVMSFSAICDVLLCHLWCLSLPFCDVLILDLYPYMGGYKSSPCDVNVSYNSFLTINTFNERINSKSIVYSIVFWKVEIVLNNSQDLLLLTIVHLQRHLTQLGTVEGRFCPELFIEEQATSSGRFFNCNRCCNNVTSCD